MPHVPFLQKNFFFFFFFFLLSLELSIHTNLIYIQFLILNHPHTNTDKPICRPDQKRVYGVARNEAAEILCEVDSYPPPETFKWSFNNTTETFDMPQSGHRIHHSAQASTLTYTPVKVSFF